MGRFLAVIGVFLLAHSVPAMPALRRALIHRLGERGFLAAYALLSLALFTWLLLELRLAPRIPLWPPGPLGYAVTVVLLPVALALLGASAFAPNPLSISLVPAAAATSQAGILAVTRHPLLWGLASWGLAHVPANGDVPSLILFGGLGVFALIGIIVIERRRRQVLGMARWQELAAGTSLVPFVALISGRARWPHDRATLTGALAGMGVAAWLLFDGHLWLFKADPLAFF